MDFKDQYPFKERFELGKKLASEHSDKLPVIVQPYGKDAPSIKRTKYLVWKSMPFGRFISEIREYMPDLRQDQALFVFAETSMPSVSSLISDVHTKYKSEDGLLYVYYCLENAFGSI